MILKDYMATKNKITGKYEAYKFLPSLGLMLKAEADTKEEAKELLKEDLKFLREELSKGTFLELTEHKTYARPDLALHIKNQKEKNEKSN